MAGRLDYSRLKKELLRYLSMVGVTTASDASSHLGISQPAFSRLVGRARDDLLVVGRARSTRYAARRDVPSVGRSVPVYEVDEAGEARRLAGLHAIQPRGFYTEALAGDIQGGVFDDLPYFLHDLRPAGFLGRLVPHRHPELELPTNIRLWTADHCLKYLTRFGWNHSGNLILGEDAFRLHLSNLREPPDLVGKSQRTRRYPRMADDVLSTGVAGSSAAGEQPKFLVARTPGPVAVLVKFSPPVREENGRRLADLLVCEHVAHGVLEAHGRSAARSEIVRAGGRIFLEVERFDRIAGGGRRGLVSLAALDAEFVGRMISWSDTAAALFGQGRIEETALRQIRWLECFGRLIADNDMHPGNLSFHTRGTKVVGLAPAYDLVPMLYSPRHGSLPDQPFHPPAPGPEDADIWTQACAAASDFWSAVSRHRLISDGFRRIARLNLSEVESLGGMDRNLPR